MERLKELRDKIESIEVSYDYESVYCDLINTCIDYMNDTQDFDLEYAWEEYCDREVVSYEIKKIVEEDDLDRLHYFLSGVDLTYDLFRINAYGNLENVTINDLKYLKQDILDRIDEKIEEEV